MALREVLWTLKSRVRGGLAASGGATNARKTFSSNTSSSDVCLRANNPTNGKALPLLQPPRPLLQLQQRHQHQWRRCLVTTADKGNPRSRCNCCVHPMAGNSATLSSSFAPGRRRPFCTRSEGGGFNEDASEPDVHVTHVDAQSSKAEGLQEGSGGDRMLPEEDRKPLGAGVGGTGETDDGGEPATVRFLDVPGSEETREEKMTIVFTCTVRTRVSQATAYHM